MSISYEELAGSPRLRATQEGVSAVRSFRVAWSDWQAFARLLLGTARTVGGVAQLTVGPKFPGFENLLVTELTVEPFDPESPDAQPDLLVERAANTYRGGARVTATYQTLYADYARLRPDLPRVPDSTFLIYRGDLGAETVRTPGRLWRYAIDDAPPVDDDVNPGLLIPTGNVQLTWLRVPSPPWNAQRTLRGKVNEATFLGAPAGTLLFLGVRAVREFQLLDDDALWRIDYHFAEQTKPLTGGGFGGWNHFYREEADAGEHWLPIADADGNPPYASGDFSALFQFE